MDDVARLVFNPKISVVKYVTVIGFRSVNPKINPYVLKPLDES